MLTNLECEDLKCFLIQEAAKKTKVFCKDCSKRQCVSCDNLRSKYLEEDQETYKKMWNNVKLVQEDGKTCVRATYLYRNPPEETFSPENSNMKTATNRTDMIINRLIKKGQLDQFQDEINKKINIGCLEQVPEAEIGALLKRVNHFCYLQLVFSESSESTSTRMINNTLTGTPGGTSFSIENKVPVSEIGDSHESLLNFLLYRFGYSSLTLSRGPAYHVLMPLFYFSSIY